MRIGRLPAGRTGHGEGFHRPPRCLSYGVLPDQRGPGLLETDPGRVQLAADGAEMNAELIPILLQPLPLQLRRPPGELERVPLELIELPLGFGQATPELGHVTFQAVALLVQLTEVAGQPLDSPRQFPR